MKHRITLHIVDGSSRSRAELARLGYALGHHAEVYTGIDELADHPPRDGVLIIREMGENDGIARLGERLNELGIWLPMIAVDEDPPTERIVAAIKAGALDYLSLPLDPEQFASCLERIAVEAERQAETRRRMLEARNRIATLSVREREVLDWLVEGCSNKAIARELSISPRTVEIHRANMMSKLGARHTADAVRLKMEARLEENFTRRLSEDAA